MQTNQSTNNDAPIDFDALQGPELHPVEHTDFAYFVALIEALRAPGGCPWDREQTHTSIEKNMVEEAYEAVAAIDEHDVEHLREELGDVLLQVVLQSQIASDAHEFTIDDVIRDVSRKIVRRHPHVFGTNAACDAAGLDPSVVANAQDVHELWDQIKAQERKIKDERRAANMQLQGVDSSTPRGLLEDVPSGQPSLMQAQSVSKKAASAGFEWDTVEDVWAQVYEEIAEFGDADEGADEEMEFGDILFSLVNVGRKHHIDAESALRRSCEKFRSRWADMERIAHEQGRRIEEYSTDELNKLWVQAKDNE
jgi:tetrapyrrole methylase family protein/MazG family protein